LVTVPCLSGDLLPQRGEGKKGGKGDFFATYERKEPDR